MIESQETFQKDMQKLILKGKILADDVLVSAIGYSEKDFIVVMVTKPKAATPAVAAPAVPVTPAAPVTIAAPVTAPATSALPLNSNFDASTLATGAHLETAIANMVEMGFPRDQVMLAMRAAFNNPDRAVEYLMTGIPESARQAAPAAPITPATPATAATASAPATTPGRHVNLFQQAQQEAQQTQQAATPAPLNADLEALRTNPQFQQLRQIVRNQPELLQPMLQQIAQSNPQLIPLINNNQEQFLQMLQEGMEEEDMPGQSVISITPEEDEAVKRLTALGFNRNMAIEAYLACDKNEELAANYLFSMQDDDF